MSPTHATVTLPGYDAESLYRAVASRDRRFDGRFVLGVTSTGIYCRPSCPARTPKQENVRYFALPAAAVAAGFRACRRCRPDKVSARPHIADETGLVERALALIGQGVVDDAGVAGLAARLSVSERHLHRLLVSSVGTGALGLAQARRAQTARTLLEQTALAGHRCRVRGRVRQPPPVQRRDACRVRGEPERAAPASDEAGPPGGRGIVGAAAARDGAVGRRAAAGVPRLAGDGGGGVVRRTALRAHAGDAGGSGAAGARAG